MQQTLLEEVNVEMVYSLINRENFTVLLCLIQHGPNTKFI
jgi:hypothetical protein